MLENPCNLEGKKERKNSPKKERGKEKKTAQKNHPNQAINKVE